MPKVIGNTVGVPNPKPDWNQNDETKADFIRNKPTKLSQFENDCGFSISGGSGNITIDDAMSDTSENAVQNKVIKTYVDGQIGDVETALDTIIAIQNELIGGDA